MNKNATPDLLLRSGAQALKIRILFWIVVIIGVVALWGGWAIFQSFGLSPADGGVLKPFSERLAFGGVVAVLGVALIAGMWLYMSLYALEVVRDGNKIAITTMTPLGDREQNFKVSELGKGAHHQGQTNFARVEDGLVENHIKVDAPWITLRAAGRRLPFILDMKSQIIEVDAIVSLAEGKIKN